METRETEVVEFKKTTSELKEGVISLASMLNKNRYGTWYFGVKMMVPFSDNKLGKQPLPIFQKLLKTI